MARGSEPNSTVSTREQRTEELLTLLTDAEGADREPIIEEIVGLNLGLCDALANRYANRGAEREDLVQVARMALLMAIKRYRPTEGRPFAAFAVPTITGELKRYFRDHCWAVRPPRRIQELRARASKQRQDMEQRLGRPVTSDELAEELDVDASLYRETELAVASYRPWSLDAPTDGPHSGRLASALAYTDTDIERLPDTLSMRRALATLSPRERQVVSWRFEEGCTQTVIANRLGISQMQVSRILRRILVNTAAALQDTDPLAS